MRRSPRALAKLAFVVMGHRLLGLPIDNTEIAAMSELPLSATSDAALQAAPATKARGYWATVGRRIRRDKVSMACATRAAADLRLRDPRAVAGS